jgi:hypothetical protein
MEEIKMGQTVKDLITGFEGVVTGHCEYISGCDQLLVQKKVDKDGNKQDGIWFDVQRLRVVDSEVISLDNSKTPGPDMAAPVK